MLRFADLRLDASSVRDLPDGSIRVTGQITQPGLRVYYQGGVKRTEYQAPEELFRQDVMDTLAGETVTLNHPPAGRVTAESWRGHTIGHVGDNVRQDAGSLVADLYIKDAAAVAAIKGGHAKHISWGYKVDYDATPGTTPAGERYDGVQRNIRGNHVAVLPVGVAPRGGEACQLRLDSRGDEEYPGLKSGVELEAALAKITALETELSRVRTDAASLPKLTADFQAANTRVAELGEALKPERLDALADARAVVVALAKTAGIETAGKSTLDLKRAIVAKRTPDLATRTDSMTEVALDAVMVVYGSQPHPTLVTALAATGATTETETRTDAAPAVPKYSDMYDKYLKDSRNAWKNTGDVSVRS